MDAKIQRNMLSKYNERIGLTFGQIMSILTLLGVMIAAWVNFNLKVEGHDGRIKTLEEGRQTNSQNIEKVRSEMTIIIEKVRTENREDHQKINDKLDELIKENKR